jgi:hypothetical protein
MAKQESLVQRLRTIRWLMTNDDTDVKTGEEIDTLIAALERSEGE